MQPRAPRFIRRLAAESGQEPAAPGAARGGLPSSTPQAVRELGRRRLLLGAAGSLGSAALGCEPSSQDGAARRAASTRNSKMTRMPVLFVGHGAPLLAIDQARGAELAALGHELPKPRALLVISAHWTARGDALALGPLAQQPLIYDFGGFPEELYRVQYPAPGGGLIAAEAQAALEAAGLAGLTLTTSQRGLDHGSWTPLVHLVPKADVPVLQLSLPIDWSGERWLALGRGLSPLRDAGVLIIGSGNITHNLGKVDPRPSATPPRWASEFDDWTRSTLDGFRMDELAAYKTRAPALATNHPTEEHWAPLLVAAGAASTTRPKVSYPVRGWEFGSLSRRSVLFS